MEPNKTFTQLMLSETGAVLTVEEQAFVETHKQIISCGTMVGRYFIELARKLKYMNDAKLYAVGGFESFSQYVEEAVGIKYRQARNYIRVAETYTDAYLEEHAGVGVTKLTLLAAVTAEEREEIEETINVETASTTEVEDAVRAALRERDEKQKQLDLFSQKNDELKEELAERERGQDALQRAYDEKKRELTEAKKQADDLKAQKTDLEKKLKDAKAAAKEVKTVPDEASKKLADEQKARADELEQKLRETNAQLEAAKQQKKTIATDDLLVFKVKFDDLQRLGMDIGKALSKMDEETAIKCKNALNAVINGWKEEMGL